MKKTNILQLYLLAAVLIIGTGLLMTLYMSERVDYKFCTEDTRSGTSVYFTVTGNDTTYYNTSIAKSNFSTKWVNTKQ